MSAVENEERGLAGEDVPWPVLRAMVLLRDEFTCAICGAYATQVDHILARIHGGSDHPLNLQAACKPCNQRKGNFLPGERFEFFAHLNLEQVRHLADEAQKSIERCKVEIGAYDARIDELDPPEDRERRYRENRERWSGVDR